MSDLYIPDLSEFRPVGNPGQFAAWTPAAIQRVTYANYHVDGTFQENLPWMRKLLKSRGWYGYMVAFQDAVSQAEFFARTLGSLEPGEYVIVDVEEGVGDQGSRAMQWLAVANQMLHANATQDWVYSGVPFWTSYLGAVSSQVHRWIAAYGAPEPSFAHALWQFTDAQTVPGVSQPMDCSVFHGTLDQFLALSAPSGAPQEVVDVIDVVTYPDHTHGAVVTPFGLRFISAQEWTALNALAAAGGAVKITALSPAVFAGFPVAPSWVTTAALGDALTAAVKPLVTAATSAPAVQAAAQAGVQAGFKAVLQAAASATP